MTRSAAVLVVCVVAAIASFAHGLARQRPAGDCLNPPITTFSTFTFYPSDYQIKSVIPVTASGDKLSTKVREL